MGGEIEDGGHLGKCEELHLGRSNVRARYVHNSRTINNIYSGILGSKSIDP